MKTGFIGLGAMGAPMAGHLAARGLLAETAEIVAPTDHGRRFLNDLLQLFLRE